MDRNGTEWIGEDGKGHLPCVHIGTEGNGWEWIGVEGTGLASSMRPQGSGVERKAEDWTGWERIGAEGIGVFQNSGGER